ncbi:MAG: N-acetyltransferase [Deltaproteobacteria bacterium]|nr:N-acetyltransferase [Deltaproteobacteria bacterium]
MILRKAHLEDSLQIKEIIDTFAEEKKVLARSQDDIEERIREFVVAEEKEIVGVSALRVYSHRLAEVRSLCVKKEYRGKSIGEKLVLFDIEEAKNLGINKVFALTMEVSFFLHLGFKKIEKGELPDKKIWKDCIHCPFFPNCPEEAVIYCIDGKPF